MPSRICDKGPCYYLEATLKILAVESDQDKLEIIVEASKEGTPKRRVILWYCPFCGSRIDPHWLKTLRTKGYG